MLKKAIKPKNVVISGTTSSLRRSFIRTTLADARSTRLVVDVHEDPADETERNHHEDDHDDDVLLRRSARADVFVDDFAPHLFVGLIIRIGHAQLPQQVKCHAPPDGAMSR